MPDTYKIAFPTESDMERAYCVLNGIKLDNIAKVTKEQMEILKYKKIRYRLESES